MKNKHKLVFGVGVNDSEYDVTKYESIDGKRKQVWVCPFYRVWASMICRGYSVKFKKKRPTYKNCYVCGDWLYFSKFKSWMENQDWEDKVLDKDLIVEGNKVYSPETCVFITQALNNFVVGCDANRGDYPIGVSLHRSGKFRVDCNNSLTKIREYLGLFNTPEEAHQAWKKRKHEIAVMITSSEKNLLLVESILSRYTE